MSGMQIQQSDTFDEDQRNSGHCICRLCLQRVPIETCSLLEGIKSDKLSIIVPELNLVACSVPTICVTCDQTLQESYNYKSSCLEIEERLQEYKECGLRSYISLQEVVISNGFIGRLNIFQTVCRTCLKVYMRDICTPLNNDLGDPLKDMIDKCLPEINLELSKSPVICQICLEVLENLFNFIMQCLDSEEKISYSCERNNMRGVVDLHKVYLFLQNMECTSVLNVGKLDTLSQSSDISECSVVDFSIRNGEVNIQETKIESKSSENNFLNKFPANVSPVSDQVAKLDTSQIVILDSDSEDLPEPEKVVLEKTVDKNNEKTSDAKGTIDEVRKKVEEMKSGKSEEQIDNKIEDDTEFTQLDELLQVKKVVTIVEKPKVKRMRKKQVIQGDSKDLKEESKQKIGEVRKESKSIYFEGEDDYKPSFRKKRRFACPKCKRKFKVKGYLQYHLRKKCKVPDKLETISEANMDKFEVKSAPSGPKPFKPKKCKWCDFFIHSLEVMKSHLNIHRVHKCSNCPMLFIKRGSRNKHQVSCVMKVKARKRRIIKTDSPEKIVKKPKLLEKKQKIIEKKQDIIPQDGISSEPKLDKVVTYGHKQSYIFDRLKLTMYKCKLCPYQTRKKVNLTRHSIVHGKSSELKLYKCTMCHFKTVKQEVLSMHMRVHKMVDVNVRKCFLCNFSTGDEDEFQRHMVEHKSEV